VQFNFYVATFIFRRNNNEYKMDRQIRQRRWVRHYKMNLSWQSLYYFVNHRQPLKRLCHWSMASSITLVVTFQPTHFRWCIKSCTWAHPGRFVVKVDRGQAVWMSGDMNAVISGSKRLYHLARPVLWGSPFIHVYLLKDEEFVGDQTYGRQQLLRQKCVTIIGSTDLDPRIDKFISSLCSQ